MRTRKSVTNNLVVMGSAAVVAVYAAGFVRTADAAEKFAELSNERRPVITPSAALHNRAQSAVAMTSHAERNANPHDAAPPTPGVQSRGTVVPTDTASTVSASASAAHENSTAAAAQNAAPVTANARAVAATQRNANATSNAPLSPAAPRTASSTARPASVSAAVITAPVASITDKTVAISAVPLASPATPVANQTVAPAPASPAQSVASSPATASAATVSAPTTPSVAATVAATDAATKTATASAPKPPLPPGVKYRDGEYYGWGTSRHGDIQAYIEVTDGKVSYVKIAQCLTQYSCGVIDVLPGQVFARNSPEVDSVSGATQSSNAFYYAVQQALSKAK